MVTENGEEIMNNTIVEFRYDASRDKYYQWIPIGFFMTKQQNLEKLSTMEMLSCS